MKTLYSMLPFFVLAALVGPLAHAQEKEQARQASVNTSVGSDGTGSIIVQAHGQLPKPPVFFTAKAEADALVGLENIEQKINLKIRIIQGNAKTLSFGLIGSGEVTEVQGAKIQSWSVRREGSRRFLELHVKEGAKELNPAIKVRSSSLTLPEERELTHLTPGDSVGFDSHVNIVFGPGVEGAIKSADGFAPMDRDDTTNRFQTSTGGQINLSLNRHGAAPLSVELIDTTLRGTIHSSGKSVGFEFRTTARVTAANTEITILSGNAAVSQLPTSEDYQLWLSTANNHPVYQLVFSEAGTFPVVIDFVAPLISPESNWHNLDFTVAASAVVPLTLDGLEDQLEFHRAPEAIVPVRDGDSWVGYLPATGRANLSWKTSHVTGEGKLFFTTTAQVEAQVSAGLLRQNHKIDYQVLQGQLDSLSILLNGPGEVLDVQGGNVVAWNVKGDGDDRHLNVTLSQPITATSQLNVRSQTPLGPFPLRVEGLRLNPDDAIRHSGYLRLSNSGSVRLEPTGLTGLTQLAPEQFPGEPIETRQTFVYRFPAAEHAFTIAADRIQPEVNISQLILYQLSETDRVISADIELDIREAPIREWNFDIPADYSVVSVVGASVADYFAASDATAGRRNLKVVFANDVEGRQLVSIQLEKNEAAAVGEWILPRIEYSGAKTVTGNIGIAGAAGFRISISATDLLVEKPLSYFPKSFANLQQAFRIRQPDWTATMSIELLERSVQSDVFHLYSLSQGTVYGSALINYFVSGAPVSQWSITVPSSLGNVMVDGQGVRTWRREGETLIVSLHQPVMGAHTVLVTFEEKPDELDSSFLAGQIAPVGVQGERGYVQVVSPMQVEIETVAITPDMLTLDPLELPAEFRLLSTAPSLGTWQYTERPFDLKLKVNWFQPGATVTQVVEFSEANSRVSSDGELVTDVVYYVKSRGQRTLKIQIPPEPVRLWAVSVNGRPVTARQAADATLIPLPGGTDPNIPVKVSLRIGKPTVDEINPTLTLPIVFAPVLKTQWSVLGEEKRVLVPNGGTVTPPVPVERPSGLDWIAKQGILPMLAIGLIVVTSIWASGKAGLLQISGVIGLGFAVLASLATARTAMLQTDAPSPLQLSLPVLSAAEIVELQVVSVPLWRVNLSWAGASAFLAGIAAIACSFLVKKIGATALIRGCGILAIAIGVLLQGDGAPWFFGLLAFAILILAFVPSFRDWFSSVRKWMRRFTRKRNKAEEKTDVGSTATSGVVTTVLALVALSLASLVPASTAMAANAFAPADSLTQRWQITHRNSRLTATGTITLSGKAGEQFTLLRAPAVLTRFEGDDLRLTKRDIPGQGLTYVISIPIVEADANEAEDVGSAPGADETRRVYRATFEYQLEALNPLEGVPVLTGSASVQQIKLSYDETGWDVVCDTAVRVEPLATDDGTTQANVLLRPGPASLLLKPRARDVTAEAVQFFVEASNLYLPSPGVVDGRHRLNIRTSQGQISKLNVLVPQGLTVSAVNGPVGSWQFDADSGRLTLEIEPAQSQAFDVMIDTQRSLDTLPADVNLAPLKVTQAGGEVGLVAVAFGPDAQPERLEPTTMSAVNLGDFDASLIPNQQAVLHRVYRYGADGGELALRVSPVESEVRVVSKQVLSLGDERVVLGVNLAAEISRAGLFQLSFPLPDGLEIESLSGDALHHWTELSENGQQQIILHLNGKTIGTHQFSITLSSAAPTAVGNWDVPRFELNEASRQTGELVVRPTTGIRLQTASRQNVSETDPRTMGVNGQGALAFRLLQRDWNLALGIEQLDAWITGQVLHDITLREGQTRSLLIADFNVQNASIRTLEVVLPITNEDEIGTLRAIGDTVSDFVRTTPDSNVWEIQFKRRIVGKTSFQIEYERRGDRANENEKLSPIGFPDARQLAYYFSVRAGGRLEIEHDTLTQGWQRADWNTVPHILREAGNRNAPALTLRAVAPSNTLSILAKRHSLADALKLRVAKGTLTTILSPTGDQLTAVELTMEVIQRSSLSVGLPVNGELFSIFVNGESVHSIRQGGSLNPWQFYILPGIDDRTANVRFVYSVAGDSLAQLNLTSPQLNVPLENIQWSVVAPKGSELVDNEGNLELVSEVNQDDYDRDSYLSKVSGKRQVQAQQAAQLLEQANQLLQAGEQTKARWALNSVANQYALDAASNEDARVQLENLQTQQAIVGLNTRRQRLFLYNTPNDAALADNEQMRQAATDNPILQRGQLNFRPQQLTQLLGGNTNEDNAVLHQLAGRLVKHQRNTEPAPQAILISLPEEGTVYSFSRSVQVAENAPLELDLKFDSQFRFQFWQTILLVTILIAIAAALVIGTKKPQAV